MWVRLKSTVWRVIGHAGESKGRPFFTGLMIAESFSAQFSTGLFCQPVDHAVEDEIMKRQYQKPIEPAPYAFGPEGRLLDQIVI